MIDNAGKRQPSHFDDTICYVGDVAYYRGTPEGLKDQIERSLKLKRGASQKDLLRAKKDLLEKIGGRSSSSVYKNQMRSVVPLYLEHRREEAKNPEFLSEHSLYESVSTMEKHLVPWFGNERLENLDQEGWEAYCEVKCRTHTLVNHRKVMNHFLKWCVHRKFLKYRPELEIPKRAKRKKRQRAVLTPDETKKVMTAANGKALLYIGMYLLMGMRNMEICKLRWDEVDLELGALQVNPLNNRRRKARAIPINTFVLELLRRLRLKQKGDWVFPSRKGKKPYLSPKGGIRKAWAKTLSAAGIDRHITPHDLRATFETHMGTLSEFTDIQREKMAGAAIDVQKNDYITMNVDQLRGLEQAVKIEGLDEIFENKLDSEKPKIRAIVKSTIRGNPRGKHNN